MLIFRMIAVVAVLSAAPALAQSGKPQRLDTEPLTVVTATGSHLFTVEIADDPHEQAIGLMHREEMAADHGMLFDFGPPRIVTMWMKNTLISLDMVFVRPDGTVARVAERTEPLSLKTISSNEPVSHVLELRGGVARLIGLKPGDRLVEGFPDEAAE